MSAVKEYLDELTKTIAALPEDKIEDIIATVKKAMDNGKKLFLMGNGGSASTASHLTADFQKGLKLAMGKRFKVISLADSIPLITAWSNDYGYERVFMEQLDSLLDEGDVVFAFSGSGNSENVLKAVERANELGGITIGFSGYEGGKLAGMCQKSVVAKSDSMQRIEDIHLIVGHIIYAVIRDTYGTTGLC